MLPCKVFHAPRNNFATITRYITLSTIGINVVTQADELWSPMRKNMYSSNFFVFF